MIKVIDSMCGSGKSTKIFEIMDNMHLEDINRSFLYVTPFLSEINDRIPTATKHLEFRTPESDGDGKLVNLLKLIEDGVSIATTHVLFGRMTPEIVNMLIKQQYVLVIDEALNCIQEESDLNDDDIHALLTSGMINIDDTKRNKLTWNEFEYPEHKGKYARVRNMCRLGVAYAFEKNFLIFEYPPELLSKLDDVFVLTYLFNGSDMRCWLELNQIPYRILDNVELGLLSEEDIKRKVRENLTILEPKKLTDKWKSQSSTALSSNWFKGAKSVADYKRVMTSAVAMNGVKKGDVFWTTYKKDEKKLAGNGYTQGVSKDMPAFLPLNIRATNLYKDYNFCMYAVNIHKNPTEKRYVEAQGVKVDQDMFALSEMIQFIWRGCIREYKPMKVLILSKRMKNLLEGWLNE